MLITIVVNIDHSATNICLLLVLHTLINKKISLQEQSKNSVIFK